MAAQLSFVSFWFPGAFFYLIISLYKNILDIYELIVISFEYLYDSLVIGISEDKFTMTQFLLWIRRSIIYFVLSFISFYVSLIPWLGSPMAMVIGSVQIVDFLF